MRNVPSFAAKLDARLEVEGIGTLRVDIAYGGDSFVIVDADALGFQLAPNEARDLASIGMKIVAAANAHLGFVHPENPEWDHISFCQFAGPLMRQGGVSTGVNAVVVRPGKIDRSPTGTGCSARMAVLRAKGRMQVGERYVARSIIGSTFDCAIEAETTVGGRAAIIPSVAGRAWITGVTSTCSTPTIPGPKAIGWRTPGQNCSRDR